MPQTSFLLFQGDRDDSSMCFNMVGRSGIEPDVPEGGGFTVRCITIDASDPTKNKLSKSVTTIIVIIHSF